MTSTPFIHARRVLTWLVCAHLCGVLAGPVTAQLAWSSTDHWTRQGRAAPWLLPPVQEHGPRANTVLRGSIFGWA